MLTKRVNFQLHDHPYSCSFDCGNSTYDDLH